MMEPKKYASFICGVYDYDDGEERDVYSSIDGRLVARVVMASREKVDHAVDAAQDAFKKVWSKTPISERRSILLRLAEIIQARSDEYALLESLNTGKTLRQTTFKDSREIVHPEYPGTRGVVEYLPLGVVAAVAPWNVPFLMAVWKVAPALLAGNTVVLKPSHFTPLTALELAEDAKRAGLPDGVLNVVVGEGSVVGDALIQNPKVAHVSFTGSTKTGLDVAKKAAGLRKITLELGGKSPNIVFEDADLERAAKGVLFGIYLNSGQLCESGSRLIVHSAIKQKLLARIVEYMRRM